MTNINDNDNINNDNDQTVINGINGINEEGNDNIIDIMREANGQKTMTMKWKDQLMTMKK